jgi:hypothetical protein
LFARLFDNTSAGFTENARTLGLLEGDYLFGHAFFSFFGRLVLNHPRGKPRRMFSLTGELGNTVRWLLF